MKLQFGQSARRVSTLAAASIGTVLLLSNPAYASYNDGFAATTTNSCGSAIFVDHGEGAPGGGSNDDYILIRDNCSDSHGVRASAWVTEHTSAGDLTYSLGSKYNGNGVAGADALVLLGDGTMSREAFRGPEGLWNVATRACETEPERRHGSLAEFWAEWQTARST